MDTLPKSDNLAPDYKQRLIRLQQQLESTHLHALFVTSQTNIFYLSGIPPFEAEKELSALITATDCYIFVRRTFKVIAEKHIAQGSLIEITQPQTIPDSIRHLMGNKPVAIGFDQEDMPVSTYMFLAKISPTIKWKTAHGMIERMRATKDEYELHCIRKAAEITDAAFTYILTKISADKTELEIALDLESYIRSQGHGLAFPPIVASGLNSISPHSEPTMKKCEKNDIVLLDFGAKYRGYCSDMTRMVVLGKPDNIVKQQYQTVLNANARAIEYISDRKHMPDIDTFEIDKVARSYIESEKFPTIPHSVGHCLGLDIHESPRISNHQHSKLVPGMVFTIEPGIYNEVGGGIRIEDLVLWNDDHSIEVLSKTPKTFVEL